MTNDEKSQTVRIVKAEPAAEQTFSARKIVIALVVLVTVCLLSLIIAGVTSLISLAERIHPLAGSIVFWTLILAAGFFSLYCLIAYAKLPAALIPPEEEFGPKHDAYLEALRVRLDRKSTRLNSSHLVISYAVF